jgi:hypothetical protein
LSSRQLAKAGWSWASYISDQPRFTYEGGKCWDYTDCYCTGCGYEFKTDTTRGWGFTGYGYYYGGRWFRFPKPFASMSGNEKAKQCQAGGPLVVSPTLFCFIRRSPPYLDPPVQSALNRAHPGFNCPASQVNLVCFRAGGYPKPSCQSYCQRQDPTGKAVYTPQSSYVTISDYYGPWGIFGGYPTYHSTPATCQWQKTTTQQVTKISLATDALGQETGGGTWTGSGAAFVEQTVVSGNRPFSLGSTVPVTVEVVSSQGPIMEGARITDGCNLGANPKKCFGRSTSENFTIGLSLLLGGLAVVTCPCLLLLCCVKGFCGQDNAARAKPIESIVPAWAVTPSAHHPAQEPLAPGYVKHQDERMNATHPPPPPPWGGHSPA